MDKFDETLLSVIDDVFLCTLGADCTKIIYNYLERRSLPKHEIPRQTDKFSEEIRKLLCDNKKSRNNPACLLEEAIAKRLCSTLGVKMQLSAFRTFAMFIRKLKQEQLSEK
ncbi:MAG: hypothetical protein NWF09_03340 [Candidatus Bathyarchaeota archaeon]|nr:hypothetical protein [Candidatus Bathyarchaeota archaeon]